MTETSSSDDLAALLARSHRVVVFSGAGISTESGIPDFRSPGGVWTRYNPQDFTFERYVRDPEQRKLSWRLRREFWAVEPDPNAAHHAVAELERKGRLLGVITQNIDGLHQDAGSQRVVEVHGTARQVGCIGSRPQAGTPAGCGWVAPARWAITALDAGDDDPRCPTCGGLAKVATISFGQQLVPEVIEEAGAMVQAADLLVTVGSSLQVYPAAGLPELAASCGVPVAIVNDEPTPMDFLAELIVRGRAGAVLPPAVAALP